MDDLISRQAAIDAVQQHREGVLGSYEYEEGVAFVYAAAHNHIIDVIKQLPSARRPVDEWCTDCSEYDTERKCCPRFNRVIRTALDDADLVSVVRCGECKHWVTVIDREKAEFGLCMVKKAEIETTLRSGFCHKGKRREELSMDIQKEYAKAVLKNSVATNADRIRSMSDEELADFLWGIGNNPATGTTYVSGKPIFTNPDGYKGWLEWLKMSLGTDNSNRCVCCGAIIPEGRMVCPTCERRANEQV